MIEQTDLFFTESHKLYRQNDPDTSKEAAELVDTTRLEGLVYATILNAGAKGIISDQVRAALPQVKSYSSVTARFKALKEKGLIEYSGERRPGVSGRGQNVMVAKRASTT